MCLCTDYAVSLFALPSHHHHHRSALSLSLSFRWLRVVHTRLFPSFVVTVYRVTLSCACRVLYRFACVCVCVCVRFFVCWRNYFLAAHAAKINNTTTQQHAHPRQAAPPSLPLAEPRAAQHGAYAPKFVSLLWILLISRRPPAPPHFPFQVSSLPPSLPYKTKKVANSINPHHLHTTTLRACWWKLRERAVCVSHCDRNSSSVKASCSW